jgi:hypothetical protein
MSFTLSSWIRGREIDELTAFNLHYDGALRRITGTFLELHISRYPFVPGNFCKGIPDCISIELIGGFEGLEEKAE